MLLRCVDELAINGWRCPLTTLIERQYGEHGSVADIFLPKWFADRLFPICGVLFVSAVVLVVIR